MLFERFRVTIDGRHRYAREWKEKTGRPVIGYLCGYVPEEILYAAGILPVRILGGNQPYDAADSHIGGNFCEMCRDILAQGLMGRYDYLDGVAHGMSCMHIRQVFHSWEQHLPSSYSRFIFVPREVGNRYAGPLFMDELKLFKNSIEQWTGEEISDSALDNSIETYNRDRRLMRRIYEYRKQQPPLLSGAEALAVTLSSQVMDKEEHIQLLEETLEKLTDRKDGPAPGPRLMILGGENDSFELLETVESFGGNIVIDDNCAGSGYFWNDVVPGDDRLEAIGRRYLERPRCPAKDSSDRVRPGHILRLARDYDVEGTIATLIKGCEPHNFDNALLIEMLEENGIPAAEFEIGIVAPEKSFKLQVKDFLKRIDN